jgi:hypothetical protein
MVELEKTAVPRQRHVKHAFTATDTQTRIEELLEAVFSLRSVPRLNNENLPEN